MFTLHDVHDEVGRYGLYNFGDVGTYDAPTNTIAAGMTGVVLN